MRDEPLRGRVGTGTSLCGMGGNWDILSAGTNEYGDVFLSMYRSILRNSEIEALTTRELCEIEFQHC